MIVFVAPYPALADENDGFIQRIAWIDSLVSDQPRVYLEISFRRFWFAHSHSFGNVKVLQLNGLLHFFLISSLFKRASVVYVHSVHNSLKALSAYWISRPITDIHGAVPEELLHQGKRWRAYLFGFVERVALRRSATVIHVTSAMKRHFQSKYGRNSLTDCIIAILPKLTDTRGQCENVLNSKRDPNIVIYAGGLQVWQNVSMMLQVASITPKFKFLFLSSEASMLRRLASSLNIANYSCFSVEPHRVPDYYLSCTYGFILRDPILLNRVACPTKLVEYLHWGVIPIVLTPDIGDFVELGFKFVTFNDFRTGRMPDAREAAQMRVINRQVVERLLNSCNKELSILNKKLNNG